MKTKSLKYLCAIVLIIILLCTTSCASLKQYLSTNQKYDRLCENPEYYTKEELTEVFYDNKEEFTEMVDIIFNNKKLLAHISEKQLGGGPIDDTFSKQFFTDEEWKKICAFFGKYKPYSIERDIEIPGGALIFYFGTNTIKSTDLFYFMNDSEGESSSKPYLFGTNEQIDEHWWIVTDGFSFD